VAEREGQSGSLPASGSGERTADLSHQPPAERRVVYVASQAVLHVNEPLIDESGS